MKLSEALKEKMFDVRLRDRLLAEGKITATQVEEYLNSLSDDSKNLTTVSDEEGRFIASESSYSTEPQM